MLKFDYLDDNDRMRQGRISLVHPKEGVVDSKIKSPAGTELVSYSDIANAQMKSYEDKIQWFQDTCAQLCVEWNEGHMRMNVRREYLLSDSMEAVMSLSRKDLRKVWRFEFIGEAGIDAGGLAREWFELVTDEVFDPDMGLWQTSATNQMCMQINPASGEFSVWGGVSCPCWADCSPLFAHYNIFLSLLLRRSASSYRNIVSRRSSNLLPIHWTRHGQGHV